MPDNWSFVIAAYGLAVVALGGYWRFLRRRERELDRLAAGTQSAHPPGRRDAGAPRPEPARPTPSR